MPLLHEPNTFSSIHLLEELKQHTLLLTKLLGIMAETQRTNKEEFLSVGQVASKLNKSKGTVRRWILENRINAVQVRGSRYMIPKSDVERIINSGHQTPFPVHCEFRKVKGG